MRIALVLLGSLEGGLPRPYDALTMHQTSCRHPKRGDQVQGKERIKLPVTALLKLIFFTDLPYYLSKEWLTYLPEPEECAVVTALGSASMVAVTFGTGTVCGIIAGEPTQRVQCYQNGLNISVLPNVSFEATLVAEDFFVASAQVDSAFIVGRLKL
ncbi:hypothetical protein CRYUN_Cryun03dG0148900 [Craigia yunnanensis]